MLRRRPRVVLWGGRRRDIQFGTFKDRLHVLRQALHLHDVRFLSGFRSHHDHVHVATSDHYRGTFNVRVEGGSIEPRA